MTSLGQLRTNEPIERAMRIIRDWLSKLGINGMTINTNYDAKMNIAMIKFVHKNVTYEFRSTKQSNCRLNMWGIARVMEYKVRASLMGIEDFEKSMKAYIQIEDKSGIHNEYTPQDINQKNYLILGISPLASNEEIKKRWFTLQKTFHPDMALSDEAKAEFNKRISEINVAYTEIKKERDIK
jgi:hypothetical protein